MSFLTYRLPSSIYLFIVKNKNHHTCTVCHWFLSFTLLPDYRKGDALYEDGDSLHSDDSASHHHHDSDEFADDEGMSNADSSSQVFMPLLILSLFLSFSF